MADYNDRPFRVDFYLTSSDRYSDRWRREFEAHQNHNRAIYRRPKRASEKAPSLSHNAEVILR